MAKRNLFPILGIAALLLSACGGTSSDSETPPSEGSTSLSEESSESESSSSLEPVNWPGEEIASYVASHLGAETEIAIPAPSYELDTGREYEISLDTSEDGLAAISVTASGDFSAYGDEIVDSGNWLRTTRDFDGYTLYHGTDFVLEIRLYEYDDAEDSTLFEIALSTGHYAVWPEEVIEKRLEAIGEGAAPLERIDTGSHYYVTDVMYSDGEPYFFVYVWSVPPEEYAELLTDGGFVTDYASGLYVDPSFKYFVELWDFYEEANQICISVFGLSWKIYINDADVLDEVSRSVVDIVYGNSYASLPTFADLGMSYATYVANTSAHLYTVYLTAYQDMALVDKTSDYAALLDASDDWEYAEGSGYWTDAATNVMKVTLLDDGNYSLVLRLEDA